MKYMLLIYSNPEAVTTRSEAETHEVYARVDAIMADLTASGELVGGEALADPSVGKVVRVIGGTPVATDGPLAEAKEFFAGYLVVDTASAERAIEIAAQWPDAADGGAMEVRPILDPDGGEDV